MNSRRAWFIVVRAYIGQIVQARWLWALVAVCILSSLATAVRSHHAYLDADDRYRLELQDRQRLRFASPAGPGGQATEPTLRVLRPPNPVSVLVAGVERTLPSGWDFGPSGSEALSPYPPQISPVSLDVLTDGESIIRLFGGLVGVVLGFWLVTRDQQRGWLAAAMSYSTAPWWPMTAILVAGAVGLAIVALIWVLVLQMFAEWLVGSQRELGFAFSATWFFVWTYLVTMFGIGAAVSRMIRNPLVGTAVAASIWTLAILMGPQLLSAVFYLVSEIPPRARMESERRETYADRRRVADDELARRLTDAVPETPTRTAFDILTEEAYPRFEAGWLSAMRVARSEATATTQAWITRQEFWLDRLETIARFTPGTLLQSALATSNGQGWATQRWWERAVHRHETTLNRVLFDDLPVVGLRLYWRREPFSWAYVRHLPLSMSQLPSLDESAGRSLNHRRVPLADVAAAMLQLTLALSVAALYPTRPEQH